MRRTIWTAALLLACVSAGAKNGWSLTDTEYLGGKVTAPLSGPYEEGETATGTVRLQGGAAQGFDGSLYFLTDEADFQAITRKIDSPALQKGRIGEGRGDDDLPYSITFPYRNVLGKDDFDVYFVWRYADQFIATKYRFTWMKTASSSQAGIYIGIAVVLLALIGGILFFLRMHSRRKQGMLEKTKFGPEVTGNPDGTLTVQDPAGGPSLTMTPMLDESGSQTGWKSDNGVFYSDEDICAWIEWRKEKAK